MSTLECTEFHGNVSAPNVDCPNHGSVATNADSTIVATERALTPRPVELDADAIARIVNQKVSWKVASAVCITIGIALIVFPAPKSIVGILDAIFTPPPGYTGGWIGLVVKHWQSCILFLIGKITWEAGR